VTFNPTEVPRKTLYFSAMNGGDGEGGDRLFCRVAPTRGDGVRLGGAALSRCRAGPARRGGPR